MKATLRKAVGRANLSFQQLKEVLIDVEVTMNNRPLGMLKMMWNIFCLHQICSFMVPISACLKKKLKRWMKQMRP